MKKLKKFENWSDWYKHNNLSDLPMDDYVNKGNESKMI